MPVISVTDNTLSVHALTDQNASTLITSVPFHAAGITQLMQTMADYGYQEPLYVLTDFHDDALTVADLPTVPIHLHGKTKQALVNQCRGDAHYTQANWSRNESRWQLRHYFPVHQALLHTLLSSLEEQGRIVRALVPVALIIEQAFCRYVKPVRTAPWAVKESMRTRGTTGLVVVPQWYADNALIRCCLLVNTVLVYQRIIPIDNTAPDSTARLVDEVRATHAYVCRDYLERDDAECPIYGLSVLSGNEPATKNRTEGTTAPAESNSTRNRPMHITANCVFVETTVDELPKSAMGHVVSDATSQLWWPLLIRSVSQQRMGGSRVPNAMNCLPVKRWQAPWFRHSVRLLSRCGYPLLGTAIILAVALSAGWLWQRWHVINTLESRYDALVQSVAEATQQVPPYTLEQLQTLNDTYQTLQFKTRSPQALVIDIARLMGERPTIRLRSMRWESALEAIATSVDDRTQRHSRVVLSGSVLMADSALASTVFSEFDTLVNDLRSGPSISGLEVQQSPITGLGRAVEVTPLLQTERQDTHPEPQSLPFTIELLHTEFLS